MDRKTTELKCEEQNCEKENMRNLLVKLAISPPWPELGSLKLTVP